jgi:hypothetical protein
VSRSSGRICLEAIPPAAPEANVTKSYRNVLTTGCAYRISTQANPANPGGVRVTSTKNVVQQAGICDEVFTMVSKKKRNKLDDLPNSWIHRSRPAMVGVRNSSASL